MDDAACACRGPEGARLCACVCVWAESIDWMTRKGRAKRGVRRSRSIR